MGLCHTQIRPGEPQHTTAQVNAKRILNASFRLLHTNAFIAWIHIQDEHLPSTATHANLTYTHVPTLWDQGATMLFFHAFSFFIQHDIQWAVVCEQVIVSLFSVVLSLSK